MLYNSRVESSFIFLLLKTEIILFYVLARQAVKTPPRRLPTVMVRSPIDSASPGGDYPLGDLSATTMEEAASGVSILPSTGIDQQGAISQLRAE